MTTYVKSDIDTQKSKVPPMMAIEDIRVRLQESVCVLECTELAIVHGAWVREVTAIIIDVLAQVTLARLTRRWSDCHIFDGGAHEPRAPNR
jgi:hypothetical protein